LDIKSGNGYPSSALSNFAPHRFMFEGVECNSMEGLLQAFKFDKIHIQIEVCKLVGYAAKQRGRHREWQRTQTLYWQGRAYPRHSLEYQQLLDRAYSALYAQSESFRKALAVSGSAVLTHSIGRSNASETILTQSEFCGRLMRLRNYGAV